MSTAVTPTPVTELPDVIGDLTTLRRVDYRDAFVVDRAPRNDETAVAWARAVLQQAPLTTRCGLLAAWTALGLRLAPGRPGRVMGWQVRRDEPSCVLLGAESRWGMSAELAFAFHEHRAWFATFGSLDNAAMRAVWSQVAPKHRAKVQWLLETAERRHCRHVDDSSRLTSLGTPSSW